MPELFVKRNAVCSAELFDPARDDQGATVMRSNEGEYLGATLMSRGRMVSIKPGEVIVNDDLGLYPCSEGAFHAMFEPLAKVIAFDPSAVSDGLTLAQSPNVESLTVPVTS